MSENEAIIGLVTIVVFGVGAQWAGRRTGIPSLLLLLPAGLLAGDVLGLVKPVEMFGDLLFPLVTLLLSLQLFQSGLQLRVSDLPGEARSSVARLVSLGLTVTFIGGTLAATTFLDISNNLAFMVGAILVVSGPTVVGPLLEVVRLKEPTGKVLLWEGTTLDPIGATLGVVVLNLLLGSARGGVHPVFQMSARLGLGVIVGFAAAGLLVFVMSRFLLTDNMEAAVALLFATLAFGVAEILLSEAGLFATVTMGFVAANQTAVATKRISGFGETLEVLIIGILFILLGALVEIGEVWEYAVPVALIVAVLVLILRPLSAALSLWRTPLTGGERAMVGWMDPRGIVAAATAAQFGETLSKGGYDTDFLLPVVFGVIFGTGVTYALTAKPVAHLLGVADPPPRGIGLIGDDPWLLPFGNCLAEAGVPTLLIATEELTAVGLGPNLATVSVRDESEDLSEAYRQTPLERVIVSARSDVITTLIVDQVIEGIERKMVMWVPDARISSLEGEIPRRWSTMPFGGQITREALEDSLEAGSMIEVVANPAPDDTVLLAAVNAEGSVNLRPMFDEPDPQDTLIGIVSAV